MALPPSPLDFESIGTERQAKIKEVQDKNARDLKVETSNMFAALEVKKPTPAPDPLRNFTQTPPTGFSQLGVQAPKTDSDPELFGHGLVGALSDISEGSVENVPTLLKPFAYPFVKAGQGILAGMEWSDEMGEKYIPNVVEQVQNLIPGQQKLERLVAEKRKDGLSQSKALKAAWEDHHGTWELPFKLPFFTTAFTPNGSITIDFQDVIEAGLNPVDLALMFGTGGWSTGTGIAASAIGRRSVGAGLKTAVGQSIGVRGIKAGTTKGFSGLSKIPGELASGGAGTRSAIAGLPTPNQVMHNATETVSDVLHPEKAYEKRAEQVHNAPVPDTVAPGVIAEEDHIRQITTKDWRFDNVLNKVPEMIRGAETTRRYKAISGMGQQTYDRIIKLADPSSVIGDNKIAKGSVIRENVAARMSQQVGLGLSYINREVFDKVFKVNQFGRSQVGNLQLTKAGMKGMMFEKVNGVITKVPKKWKNANGDLVDVTEAQLLEMQKTGFMMGDILEMALSDLTDDFVAATSKTTASQATRSRANSYFTGLTPDQNLALDRFHKYTKDWLDLAEKEGAIVVKDGRRVGFKFGDEATQEFGDIGEMFRYQHREVISKELVELTEGVDVGDINQVIMNRTRGDGLSTGRTAFDKSRQFDTMEDGARSGILYAHPMEAAESMAITISQLIADKRAMNYLKRENIVVTSVDAFERLFPRMTEDIAGLRKAQKAALANLNRLLRKELKRKAKAPLISGNNSAFGKSVKDVNRRSAEAATAGRQAENQLIILVRRKLALMEKNAAYSALLKTATKTTFDGDGRRIVIKGREKSAEFTQEKVAARALRTNARTYYGQAKRVFGEKISAGESANRKMKAAARRNNTAANHVQRFDEELLGITNSLPMAQKELDLVTSTLERIEKLKRDRMTHIAASGDAQLKAFGETSAEMKKSQIEVTHFHNGPLANSFAPESHAKELQKTFGDNGIDALRQIEKVTGTARTLAAGSADIGWMGIQGALLAATHPVTFVKASVNSLEAILQPGKRDVYVVDNMPDIIDFLKNGGDLGSSEFFTAIDRTGMLSSVTNWLTVKEGKLPKYMPGGGNKIAPRGSRIAQMTEKWGRDVKPLGRLGAGFNTFVDISKVELWKSFNPMVAAGSMTRREIASYVNNTMGTLNTQMLGVRQSQRQLEGGLLLFSPRFTRSAFAVTGQAMKALTGGAKGAGQIEGLATREAVKSISGMIASATTLMGGYAMATGQWEEFKANGLNPMKPGWLTVDVGGQKVGVGGSTRSLIDTIFKSAAAMAEMDGKQADDLMKWNIFDPLHRAQNPIPNFWLNRTAPMVRDFMLGETFEGEQLDSPSDYVIEGMLPKFAPFAMQSYLNPGVGNARPSAVAMIPESAGLRARPLSIFERRSALRDELSKDAYDRKWEQLDVDERNEVESLDENNGSRLKELDELVETVESPTVGRYFADRKAVDTMVNEELQKASNGFTEHQNGAKYRERYDNVMREGRNSRTRIEKGGIHDAAIEYLDDKRQARLGGETLFNQIYDQYVDTVKNVDNYKDELTGLVDWDKRDIAEKAFQKNLVEEFGKVEGVELYTRMKNNYTGRNANGDRYDQLHEPDFPGQRDVWALRDAREALNSVRYWQVARDIIGSNNPEMLSIWNQYEMSDPLTQEGMRRQYRGLERIAKQVTRRRDRKRKEHPEVDKALMDFYGHRAKNRENVQLERADLRDMRQGSLTQPPVR
jgi:hypothetical protein